MTPEQVDDLFAGRIPCPGCRSTCAPTFREAALGHDITLVSWRDGRWQRGFLLCA